jgi:site-specific recombinase XerC
MQFEPFLDHLRDERNCSPATIRAYKNDLQIFAQFAKDHGVRRANQIDHGAICEFIRSMKESPNGRSGTPGLSDATIGRRLAVISSFLEYQRVATSPKLQNPIKRLRRKGKKNDDCKAVDEAVLDKLLSGISVLRDRVLIALFLASGLRLSELCQLNRDSIAFEMRVDSTGQQRFMGSGEVIGKGGKKRRFFVDGDTLKVYAGYLSTRADTLPPLFLSERKRRISPRAIQFMLSTWCKRLGLPPLHPHQLRHSFATKLANADIDSTHLRELMGHSSFATTLRYFRLHEQTLAAGYFSAMELYRSKPDKRCTAAASQQ